MLTLYLGTHHGWWLLLLPALLAADNAFTWGAQHLHISHTMDNRRTGRDLALMNILLQIGGIIAPLLGGLLAVWLGQAWLTAIAALCLLVALVPVRRATAAHNIASNERVEYNFKHAPLRDIAANFAFNFHALVGNIVWPFYLAVVLPNFHSIGLITATSSGVAFVLLLAAGRRGDRGKNHYVLREGTALVSLGHIGRLFAVSPFSLAIVSSVYSSAISYQNVSWTSLYYRHARESGINYIMSMEIACDIANIVLWGIMGSIAYLTGSASHACFTVIFILAAIVAWGCLLVRRDDHLLGKRIGPPTTPLA